MANASISMLYDPLEGKLVKKMRSSDIFTIATSGSVSATSGSTITSGTTDAYTEVYVTNVVLSSDSAGNVAYITVGTSTVMPVMLPANNPVSIRGSVDSPLFKIPSSTTVSIVAGSSGTFTAHLSGVRFPKVDYVETS